MWNIILSYFFLTTKYSLSRGSSPGPPFFFVCLCFWFSRVLGKLVLCVVLTSVCPPEQFPQVKEPQKTFKTTWNVSRKVSAGFTFLVQKQRFAKFRKHAITIYLDCRCLHFKCSYLFCFAICGIWHAIGFIVCAAFTERSDE